MKQNAWMLREACQVVVNIVNGTKTTEGDDKKIKIEAKHPVESQIANGDRGYRRYYRTVGRGLQTSQFEFDDTSQWKAVWSLFSCARFTRGLELSGLTQWFSRKRPCTSDHINAQSSSPFLRHPSHTTAIGRSLKRCVVI